MMLVGQTNADPAGGAERRKCLLLGIELLRRLPSQVDHRTAGVDSFWR